MKWSKKYLSKCTEVLVVRSTQCAVEWLSYFNTEADLMILWDEPVNSLLQYMFHFTKIKELCIFTYCVNLLLDYLLLLIDWWLLMSWCTELHTTSSFIMRVQLGKCTLSITNKILSADVLDLISYTLNFMCARHNCTKKQVNLIKYCT